MAFNGLTLSPVYYITRVINSNGSPVPNAAVTISGISALTDVDGYALIGVNAGTATITAIGYKKKIEAFTFVGQDPFTYVYIFTVYDTADSATTLICNSLTPVSIPTTLNTGDCFEVERVFYGNPLLAHENDKSSFLFKRTIESDLVSFSIELNGATLITVSNDNYGVYYESFTNNTLFSGFIADWLKIGEAFGVGQYRIIANLTILGATYTVPSNYFNLEYYHEKKANGTVKIEAFRLGYSLKDDIDYSTLLVEGWYQSKRFVGHFGNKTNKFEVETFLNGSYKELQITSRTKSEYKLTGLVSSVNLDFIQNGLLLSPTIYITDYNIANDNVYRYVPVNVVEFGSPEYIPNSTRQKMEVSMASPDNSNINFNE